MSKPPPTDIRSWVLQVNKRLTKLERKPPSTSTGMIRTIIPTQGVPNVLETKLANTIVSLQGATESSNTFILQRGWWSMTLTLSTQVVPSAGGRMFVCIFAPNIYGSGSTTRIRNSFGPGENVQTTSAVVYSDGTGVVDNRFYHETGGTVSVGGLFWAKFLG